MVWVDGIAWLGWLDGVVVWVFWFLWFCLSNVVGSWYLVVY